MFSSNMGHLKGTFCPFNQSFGINVELKVLLFVHFLSNGGK